MIFGCVLALLVNIVPAINSNDSEFKKLCKNKNSTGVKRFLRQNTPEKIKADIIECFYIVAFNNDFSTFKVLVRFVLHHLEFFPGDFDTFIQCEIFKIQKLDEEILKYIIKKFDISYEIAYKKACMTMTENELILTDFLIYRFRLKLEYKDILNFCHNKYMFYVCVSNGLKYSDNFVIDMFYKGKGSFVTYIKEWSKLPSKCLQSACEIGDNDLIDELIKKKGCKAMLVDTSLIKYEDIKSYIERLAEFESFETPTVTEGPFEEINNVEVKRLWYPKYSHIESDDDYESLDEDEKAYIREKIKQEEQEWQQEQEWRQEQVALGYIDFEE